MNYTVTEDKLQDLNEIVGNQGGVIPSKVSDALAALDVAVKTGNKKEAQKQFDVAVEANKLNGAAWSSVQKWHDDVKASGAGHGTPGGGKPTTPTTSGTPMATTPNDGKTYTFGPLVAGSNVTTKAGGDGRFTAAVPSGNAYWKVYVNGKLERDGGMDYTPVKAGDTIEWGITTPAVQDTCNYTIG